MQVGTRPAADVRGAGRNGATPAQRSSRSPPAASVWNRTLTYAVGGSFENSGGPGGQAGEGGQRPGRKFWSYIAGLRNSSWCGPDFSPRNNDSFIEVWPVIHDLPGSPRQRVSVKAGRESYSAHCSCGQGPMAMCQISATMAAGARRSVSIKPRRQPVGAGSRSAPRLLVNGLRVLLYARGASRAAGRVDGLRCGRRGDGFRFACR